MISFIESWWDALNFNLQIFYGIAIVALIFLVFQMITTFFFGMDDASGGVDIPDHDSGMSIFSVRGITAFFTGFGWTGVICTKSGMALIPSVAIAFVVGSSLMLLIYLMMRSLMRLQSSGTLDYSNAVGQIATVYLTISPVQRPGGQVEVMIQGRLVTAEALQKGSQPLSPGTKVKIVDKIGLTALLVEPLD
jgi:membrane protein implicated in regulation of membrane protease activity